MPSAWQRAARQARGAASERWVAKELSRCDGYYLINGALPRCRRRRRPRPLIAPGGGNVKPDRDGSLLTGQGRRVPGDPIQQARRQAAALSSRTGLHALTVVCVPDMRSEALRTRQGVWVCSVTQLPSVVTAAASAMSAQQAAAAAARIPPGMPRV